MSTIGFLVNLTAPAQPMSMYFVPSIPRPMWWAGVHTLPIRLDRMSSELNLLLFKNVGHFLPNFAHDSVHRPEVQIDGTLANFSTVIGPFFDRFTEVEPDEDARIRILGRRLGEAGIRAERR